MFFGLGLYLNAWFALDTERSHAHGIQRIPWSKVAEYGDRNGFDVVQAEDLWFYIQSMETEHLKRVAKKLNPPKTGKGRRGSTDG